MRQPLLALTFLLLASTATQAQNQSKPRVFVFESDSWEIGGGGGGSPSGFGIGGQGGARPQTAEIIKTFNERCRISVVTMHKDRADYLVRLEHEGGKDIISRDNKFVLFNQTGDAIESGSTRSLGNAVKDACKALLSDWRSRGTPTSGAVESREERRERVVRNE